MGSLDGKHALVTGGGSRHRRCHRRALAARRRGRLTLAAAAARLEADRAARRRRIACRSATSPTKQRSTQPCRRARAARPSTSWSTTPAPPRAPPAEDRSRALAPDDRRQPDRRVPLVHRRLAGMRASRRGRIVNHRLDRRPARLRLCRGLCAAKHGVVGLTRALALERAGRRDRQRGLPRLHRDAAARASRSSASSSTTGRSDADARAHARCETTRRAASSGPRRSRRGRCGSVQPAQAAASPARPSRRRGGETW